MSKKEKIYLLITIVITVGVAACSGLFFWRSYVRFVESLRDLGLSIAGVVCFVLGIDASVNSGAVTQPSSVLSWQTVLDWETIKTRIVSAAQLFADGQNFINYVTTLAKSAYIIVLVVTILITLALVVILLTSVNFSGRNVDKHKESAPLKVYKAIERRAIYPVKEFFVGYGEFFKTTIYGAIFKRIWQIVIVLSINIPAVIVEILASYFYLMGSFDFTCLPALFTKLLLDISVPFKVPLIVWILGAIAFIFAYRKKRALNKLYSRDSLNVRLVKSLPTSVCVAAPMGYGKGRFITSVVMVMQRVFREKALSSMLEIKSLFPEFSWGLYEEYLRMQHLHKLSDVDTLQDNFGYTAERYINDSQYRIAYDRAASKGRVSLAGSLWGYDYNTYGVTRNTGLKMERLSDCLRDYAKLFFIYDCDTSLIYSNYAICVRTAKADAGNFPLWQYNDFCDVDPHESRQHSHILDFDMMRLGKKVGERATGLDNAMEFGVLALQEMDKERGNQLDTREMRIKDDEANPKNDGMNSFIKMSNHMTYIRGEAYFFDINDMQRLDSINADFREVGYQLELKRAGDRKLLLPFFDLEELAYQIIVPWWQRKFLDYRYRRGDNNLTFYLLDKLSSAIERHYNRIYNTYSCMEQSITLEGDKDDIRTFYVMPKQIYSEVYARDAMGDFFRKKAEQSHQGINDVPVYKGVKATYEELKAQHSYFVERWAEALSGKPDDRPR